MTTIGTPQRPRVTRLLLLGSGELGKEVAIEAQTRPRCVPWSRRWCLLVGIWSLGIPTGSTFKMPSRTVPECDQVMRATKTAPISLSVRPRNVRLFSNLTLL